MQPETAQPTPRALLRAETSALLTLGLPLVGSMIGQMLIGITDTIMMGWYSVVGLAALSVSASIFFIIFIFGSGFAWGIVPMVAGALAKGEDRQVRRVTRMGLWLSIGFGILVTPFFFFGETILLALGQAKAVAHEGGIYMPIIAFGMIPALLTGVFKGYLTALELTRAIFIAVLGAALINAIANYVLIFGNFGAPELGIAGAAIASLFSHTAGFLALAIYAIRKCPQYELLKNFHRPDPEALAQVFRVGLPIGLTLLAETGLFAASSIMMGWLGTVPLAAHGIAIGITSISFMVPLGLSQAATVRIGRAWGRDNKAELRAAGLAACLLAVIAMVVIIFLFLTIPGPLVSLFIDPTDPARDAILAVGISLLMMAALFQVADIGQVIALGLLRGVQDTKVPLWIAVISYWGIGFPTGYLLGFVVGWEGIGVWLGLTTGLAAACVMMQWRFWNRYG